ncbi:hypothetical protein IE4803_PB00170 (plasmid) [Rhizobium etli bv. phaseoli str. IE4803]|nr:hypothetical protein IE4803_PB00170 [Rhizobium etli bv. phaseoli str. IE4803]
MSDGDLILMRRMTNCISITPFPDAGCCGGFDGGRASDRAASFCDADEGDGALRLFTVPTPARR